VARTFGDWVCPACGGDLDREDPGTLSCVGCRRSYPVEAAIADLRLLPDPYIDFAADRQKGSRLLQQTADGSLDSTIAAYYAMTPGVRPEMAARYTARALAEPEIGRQWLAEISRRHAPNAEGPPHLLQVGCRTGGFLEVATRSGYHAAGIDIAFRWLVVAGRRLESAGADAEIACADPEHIPLPDAAVDVVVAADVLQHLSSPDAAIREFHRILRPGGFLYITTPNRFSLGPEPHTWIWGLGFLPRRFAVALARSKRGVAYEHIRPLSLGALRRLLADGWRRVEIWPGPIPSASTAHLRPAERRLASIYERLRAVPLARSMLRRFGPLLHAGAERADEPTRSSPGP